MKNLTALITLFISLSAAAQVLEARPFEEVLETIEQAQFKAAGRGLIFGYVSIQSCFYVANDVVVLKNYCYPARPYPARGYTIISPKFGMIELYEEKYDDEVDRRITIVEFPEILRPYLTTPMRALTVPLVSSIIEETYNHYYPGCWTDLDGADCTVASETVVGFDHWAQVTQGIVKDEAAWNELYTAIQGKLP